MALFDQLGTRRNNNDNFIADFQRFAQNYRGNPQQQVQQMLNSGQITPAQYQRAQQLTNQIAQKANLFRQLFNF